MSEMIKPVAEILAGIMEMAGILIIVAIAAYAVLRAGVDVSKRKEMGKTFRHLRLSLGRGILLGF